MFLTNPSKNFTTGKLSRNSQSQYQSQTFGRSFFAKFSFSFTTCKLAWNVTGHLVSIYLLVKAKFYPHLVLGKCSFWTLMQMNVEQMLSKCCTDFLSSAKFKINRQFSKAHKKLHILIQLFIQEFIKCLLEEQTLVPSVRLSNTQTHDPGYGSTTVQS